MNIYKIYGAISPIFRRKRFEAFKARIAPKIADSLLDVGGEPSSWTAYQPVVGRIVMLNVYPLELEKQQQDSHSLEAIEGDGCHLPYKENEFDIVFSNSVIEHVGTWENQVRFAAEVRRVGEKLWIQTPAREFVIEPHYIAPFIHWFPRRWQKKLVRWFTVRGWTERMNQDQVNAMVEEIRLIGFKEMKELFPDCEIIRERFLGVFTKSYIAVRHSCE